VSIVRHIVPSFFLLKRTQLFTTSIYLLSIEHIQNVNNIQGTPPNPFASANISTASFTPLNDPQPLPKDGTPVSLSVNYLPSKFSNTLLAPGARKRKGKGIDPLIPKRGGGVKAFRGEDSGRE
jgi:hypothetical protein